MNPLQTLHEATIAKERTMATDTANDRIEGYWQRVINWLRAALS